ncbi:MAG: 2-amino-4-hydroxy-6-hydroxymethyldihydropteridine diphosphokinase [Acidobacteriia bacterium]|nr:2-amino-4-hydroxy-6-hydroxymethyldihydropteridine diphosphokinase [Terriglobia bacterium]
MKSGDFQPHEVFLGLGSNVGDAQEHLRRAGDQLTACGLILKRASSIYKTSPVDFVDQEWFLNQVLRMETSWAPERLLIQCREIETALGRVRAISKGPRTIDIDILLFDEVIFKSPELTIPHPRLAERKFVLVPLCEIAPRLLHPVLRKSMQELLDSLQGDPAVVQRL